MSQDLYVLCWTALAVGVVHTALGPDHYLPFVAMSRAGKWTLRKTVVVTVLCGLGHVLGSIALGALGIATGIAVFTLEGVETARADVAGWIMLAFGLLYFTWGVRQAIRNKPHAHWHAHVDGTTHEHTHDHSGAHLHVHAPNPPDTAGRLSSPESSDGHVQPGSSMTPWVLFTVFLFGPCEPLIPLLMYPAAKGRLGDVVLVTALFTIATVTTMTAAVVAANAAVGAVVWSRLERYSHAVGGLVVLACGVALKLGL